MSDGRRRPLWCSCGELAVVAVKDDGQYCGCCARDRIRELRNELAVKSLAAYAAGRAEGAREERERFEARGGGCEYAGPGRGDCEHFVGLPGQSRPGQHDGPDDTVDHYGRPNGWCWSCWRAEHITQLQRAARGQSEDT